jgi:adenylate cyclase
MQRRLAAIMAADMVGYSRLMAADEGGTIQRQKSYRRDLIDPKVGDHGGRVFKSTGDGYLVEFSSAVSAVQCAVEIQRAIADLEANVSTEQRIEYRVGINLGDILVDEDDIFGDGVNVAARLEQLADAGGICISDVVYQNVKSKLDLRFENLGAKALKNIPREIQVYRVRPHANAPTVSSPTGMDNPALPAKPSIAVLPFTNMSNVHDQEFFADGITEDLITALSRIRELFVISRNSSFVYKGRAVRIEDVARELGVRYILEGSVRVAGNRVRVTAQLIDGLSAGHVWAERFDESLEDIFAVQDEITRSIAVAVQVNLTYGELARLWEGQTKDLRAWEKMARGRDLFLRFNSIDNRDAQRAFKDALAIDPNYTGAMVQLGLSYWWEARFNKSVDREHYLQLAEQQVENALGIDANLGSAYMLRGGIAFLRDQHDEAVRLCERAVELAPSDSWAIAFLGLVCTFSGKAEKAVASLKTAMRLSPHYPAWYLYQYALAHLWTGDLAAAREAAEVDIKLEPDDPYSYFALASVYAFQEREDDAARVVSELRKRFPAFGVRDLLLSERYKERDKLDRIIDALRQAGLPE